MAVDPLASIVMVLLGLGLGLRVYATIRKSGGGIRSAQTKLSPSASASNSQWKRPQPISVRLPIATVFDTIVAEVPESSFWQHSWQHISALGEADTEEVIPRLQASSKRGSYSAQLKAISSDVERLVELILNIDLIALDCYSTRINFEFIGLGGEDSDQENAAAAFLDQLESALRIKLSLIATLYQVAASGAVLTEQVEQIRTSVQEQNEQSNEQEKITFESKLEPKLVPEIVNVLASASTPDANSLAPTRNNTRLCPSCNHTIDEAFSFCLHCGKALQ